MKIRNVFSIMLILLQFLSITCFRSQIGLAVSRPSKILSVQRVRLQESSLQMASIERPTSLQDTKSSSELTSFGRLAYRCTVLSWWVQIVLTVISGVILTFANTVRQSSNSQSFWTSGFAFSSIGVAISFVSSFLTWNNTRICRRLRNEVNEIKARSSLQDSFKFSIATGLIGMLITLMGAEQIVGTLASKVLSLQGIQPILGTLNQQNTLQALDIFLVQANTNTLLALFAPVVCYLILLQYLFPVQAQATTSTIIQSEVIQKS
jgi:Protein of unknown function (DUF3611)